MMMNTRSFKSIFGTFLVVLLSIGITISTLHSHHHMEWHQTKNAADTGTCISADTTVCPICGHLLQTDLAPTVTAAGYLNTYEIIPIPSDYGLYFCAHNSVLSRAPPALA